MIFYANQFISSTNFCQALNQTIQPFIGVVLKRFFNHQCRNLCSDLGSFLTGKALFKGDRPLRLPLLLLLPLTFMDMEHALGREYDSTVIMRCMYIRALPYIEHFKELRLNRNF